MGLLALVLIYILICVTVLLNVGMPNVGVPRNGMMFRNVCDRQLKNIGRKTSCRDYNQPLCGL